MNAGGGQRWAAREAGLGQPFPCPGLTCAVSESEPERVSRFAVGGCNPDRELSKRVIGEEVEDLPWLRCY